MKCAIFCVHFFGKKIVKESVGGQTAITRQHVACALSINICCHFTASFGFVGFTQIFKYDTLQKMHARKSGKNNNLFSSTLHKLMFLLLRILCSIKSLKMQSMGPEPSSFFYRFANLNMIAWLYRFIKLSILSRVCWQISPIQCDNICHHIVQTKLFYRIKGVSLNTNPIFHKNYYSASVQAIYENPSAKNISILININFISSHRLSLKYLKKFTQWLQQTLPNERLISVKCFRS